MYKLHGALGSPYSMKMRALMRYRRIPFQWVQDMARRQQLFASVKAPVIPLLELPGGRVENDSTHLTRLLEAQHADRSVIRTDACHAFLAFLIEDFADEWLTKAMFGYRWLHPQDQAQMSRWLLFDALPGAGDAQQSTMAQAFRDRQVGRMGLVGCTAENFPVIEASTRAVLQALDDSVSSQPFLFGSRPSEAEFALYGQLSQLAVDPTPAAMLRRDFPLALRWLSHIDDLSGVEGQWGPWGPAVEPILKVVGTVYLPFLAANARAVAAGAERFEVELLGRPFVQPPFRYQARCLAALRQAFAAIDRDCRRDVEGLLALTDCLPFLES